MSQEKNGFADSVSKLRAKTRLSQAEIAKRSTSGGHPGISPSYISLLEAGKMHPESLTLERIIGYARGLEVPPTLLVALTVNSETADSEIIIQTLEYMRLLPENRQKDLFTMARLYFAEKSREEKGEAFIIELSEEDDLVETKDLTKETKSKTVTNGKESNGKEKDS